MGKQQRKNADTADHCVAQRHIIISSSLMFVYVAVARENSPVHRRDAPLRRHTKLIRTVSRQREQQYGGVAPRHSVPDTIRPTSPRVFARTDSIIVSQIRPSHRRFFPPQLGFTTVYRTSHYPPLRLANSSFPGCVARVHEGRGIHTRDVAGGVLSRRRSRRNAVIDRARRGRLWSPRGIAVLTLQDDEGYIHGI